MLSKDNLKAQAKKLVALLASHEGPVRYQDALELLAQLNGHRNWRVMSAKLDQEQVEPLQQQEVKFPSIQLGADSYSQSDLPGTGFLYRVPISVDTSMTAVVLVRANDREEAIDRARSLVADGKARMDVDDGNYRGRADHYCPDSSDDAVYRLDEPLGVASSDERTGRQVGAFYVELTDLGDGDDGLLWADLTVFSPDEDEGVPTSCLSCVAESASPEEIQAFCQEAAELLHLAVPDVRNVDHGLISHAFTRAVQAGLTQETKDFVLTLFRR